MALLGIILKDVVLLFNTYVKSNDRLKTFANNFYNTITFEIFWYHLFR